MLKKIDPAVSTILIAAAIAVTLGVGIQTFSEKDLELH